MFTKFILYQLVIWKNGDNICLIPLIFEKKLLINYKTILDLIIKKK